VAIRLALEWRYASKRILARFLLTNPFPECLLQFTPRDQVCDLLDDSRRHEDQIE